MLFLCIYEVRGCGTRYICVTTTWYDTAQATLNITHTPTAQDRLAVFAVFAVFAVVYVPKREVSRLSVCLVGGLMLCCSNAAPVLRQCYCCAVAADDSFAVGSDVI